MDFDFKFRLINGALLNVKLNKLKKVRKCGAVKISEKSKILFQPSFDESWYHANDLNIPNHSCSKIMVEQKLARYTWKQLKSGHDPWIAALSMACDLVILRTVIRDSGGKRCTKDQKQVTYLQIKLFTLVNQNWQMNYWDWYFDAFKDLSHTVSLPAGKILKGKFRTN